MTLCNGGFLPFELGEITGKFNHPLEQVSLSLKFTQFTQFAPYIASMEAPLSQS